MKTRVYKYDITPELSKRCYITLFCNEKDKIVQMAGVETFKEVDRFIGKNVFTAMKKYHGHTTNTKFEKSMVKLESEL